MLNFGTPHAPLSVPMEPCAKYLGMMLSCGNLEVKMKRFAIACSKLPRRDIKVLHSSRYPSVLKSRRRKLERNATIM